MRLQRAARNIALMAAVLYLLGIGYRIVVQKIYIWFPGYLRWWLASVETPRDPTYIFFLYTVHFEPAEHAERVRRWEREYPPLADRHRDSTRRPLQLTWFYPAEQPVDSTMLALRRLTAAGYGETELHLHHQNDTYDSALRRYRDAIAYFQRFGFLKTTDGQTRFAFIHGNNALDNSMGSALCGVSRELQLLRALGCFADFSFVSLWREAQPSLVNTIFEATDDDRPKSYDRGVPVRAGRSPSGDLVIFPGPLLVSPTLNPRKLFFVVEDGDIHPSVPTTESRVDRWIRANIHVSGRPDWVFVKVHGHAASSEGDVNETLGPHFDHALSYLERRYNDGERYVLRYITAREAFNLVRAAMAGERGEPLQYYDWVVKPYVASPRGLQQSRGR